MNRINQVFLENKKLISIYFTAGYPSLDNTVSIIEKLEKNGVDLIEIGLPFSDPLADGPTIQESSSKALENGMNSMRLFEQLQDIRDRVALPILIMGYFNPIFQFGVEKFCEKCAQIGIDGLIIPDLPIEEYVENYQAIFEKYGIINIFLITPQTTEERIRYIDDISSGFIYMVSSAAVTGAKKEFDSDQIQYFSRIKNMKLKTPLMIGFGVSNPKTVQTTHQYSNGCIIGSAFIKGLNKYGTNQVDSIIKEFIAP